MAVLFCLMLLTQTGERDLFEIDTDLPEELPQKEVLAERSLHPLDLNRATREELLAIPFLNPVAVDRIIRFRQVTQFERVEDLLKIPGFDSSLVVRLGRFVTAQIKIQKLPPAGRHWATRVRVVDKDFSLDESFKNRSVYARVVGEAGNGRFVVITEKDSGETNAFDFLSAGIGYGAAGSRVVVGHYLATVGQGLVLSGPFSFITSREFSLDVGKTETIEPPTIVSENQSLFGIGYAGEHGSLMPMVFFSRHKLDAAVNADGTIDRIVANGLHCDSASLAGKDRLGEWLAGGRLALKKKTRQFGVTGYANHYDRRFSPRDSTDSFAGDHLLVVGADYLGIVGSYCTYGEIGYSPGNGGAAILGIAGDQDRLKIGFNLRGYQKRFFSPHSRVSSLENHRDRLEAHFSTRYRFKDFRFFCYGTTYRDFITDSMPTRFELGLEKRERSFELGLTLKQSMKEDAPRSQGMRFDIAWTALKPLRLATRLEDRYAFEKTVYRSFLVSAECDWDLKAIDLTARCYRFSIGSSSNRISAYEPGLPGLGGNHAFDGSGIRVLVVATVRITNGLRLALKTGMTKTDSTTLDGAAQVEMNI